MHIVLNSKVILGGGMGEKSGKRLALPRHFG